MKAQIITRDFSEQNVGTYFRARDVMPKANGNTIEIWDGVAYQASWGKSQVTSKVIRNDDQLVIIEVTGWHKHTVSPVGGTYYFVNEGGKYVRRRANAKAVKALLK